MDITFLQVLQADHRSMWCFISLVGSVVYDGCFNKVKIIHLKSRWYCLIQVFFLFIYILFGSLAENLFHLSKEDRQEITLLQIMFHHFSINGEREMCRVENDFDLLTKHTIESETMKGRNSILQQKKFPVQRMKSFSNIKRKKKTLILICLQSKLKILFFFFL